MSIFHKKMKAAVEDGLNKAQEAMQPEGKEKTLLSSLPAPIFGKVARMAIAVMLFSFFTVFTFKMLDDPRALALLLIPAYFVVQIVIILISYKKGKYVALVGVCMDVPKQLLPGASERARKVIFEVTNEDGETEQKQFRAVFWKDEFVQGLCYKLYANRDDDSVLFAWELIGKKTKEE